MAQQTQITQLIELGVAQIQPDARNSALALAALAQENARARITANAPAALVDNSGGLALGGNIPVILPAKVAKDGATTLVAKAEFDDRTILVANAHEELSSYINTVIATLTGGAGKSVGSPAGAPPNLTIEAVSADLIGGTTNLVEAKSALVEIVKMRNAQAALAAGLNYCNVAVGLPTMPDSSGGVFEIGATEYLVDNRAGTAAAVTNNGEMSLDLAETNTAFNAIVSNIATMANLVKPFNAGIPIGPFVIATNNAHTRFMAGDTDSTVPVRPL